MTEGTTGTAVFLTLREAAKRCGMSKSALSRKVQAGEISIYEKGADGSYRIDPSELLRFADAAKVSRCAGSAGTTGTNGTTPGTNGTSESSIGTAEPLPQLAVLEARMAQQLAEARLALAEERLADLKVATDRQLAEVKSALAATEADRDRWHEQAAAVTRLLPAPAPRLERRGWWRWLKRAG